MSPTKIEEKMLKQDETIPSVSDRAVRIYSILKKEDVTNWDVICFCVEYLASMSLMYEWLKPYVKPIVSIVYKAHYYLFNEVSKAEVKLKDQDDDLIQLS